MANVKPKAKYYNDNARKSAEKYMRENCITVSFRLNKATEPDLIAIYRSMPNSMKASIFKETIRKWGEDNLK